MLIFGNKTNETFLLKNPNSRPYMSESEERNKDEAWCLDVIYAQFQVLPENVSSYFISNTPGDSDRERLLAGDEFNLEWTVNEISGIDFSPEDNKGYLSVETDKNFINDTGAPILGTANVTFTMLDKDKNVDTDFNDTIFIRIHNNVIDGVFQKLTFVNGISTLEIKKDDSNFHGGMIIPLGEKYADLSGSIRINNKIIIHIYKG